MKESATIALEYIKSHAQQFGLDTRIFEQYKIHMHIPEGATPKDGPSAGIAMLTSIFSVLTQRKVKKHLAMTGEITLRGKVLPVGGLKEKILAAKRAGIKEIIGSTIQQGVDQGCKGPDQRRKRFQQRPPDLGPLRARHPLAHPRPAAVPPVLRRHAQSHPLSVRTPGRTVTALIRGGAVEAEPPWRTRSRVRQ